MSTAAAYELDHAAGVVDFCSVSAVLADLEPGVLAMAYLRSLEGEQQTAFERVEVLKAWERQHAWVLAQIQAAVIAVAGPERDQVVDDADDFSREEVALALRLSPRTAGKRLHAARMLHRSLLGTAALLEQGAVSWPHALVMVEECTGLPDTTIAAVEARVLARAPIQTAAQFGRSVRRAVIACADVSAELACAVAKTERGVWLRPEPDGMATLTAFLPAAEARAAFTRIDDAARKTADTIDADGRTLGIDERRADAFFALLFSTATGEHRKVTAEVHVVVDVATLLGLADHPAELVGYGPIPPGLARQLASDASWRRLVTDPVTGYLLDYGRTTYRVPKALPDYVQARDRTCRLPGCGQPARCCDIDHDCPWSQGGTTSARNCGCLCRRHHRMKTRGGWRLELHDDGSCTWSSATGHRYDTGPPAQLDSG